MPSITGDVDAPSKLLLIGKSGCLSGDTTVIMYKGTKQREPTLRQLYAQVHGLATGSGVGNWNPNTPIYLFHDEDGYTAKGKFDSVSPLFTRRCNTINHNKWDFA